MWLLSRILPARGKRGLDWPSLTLQTACLPGRIRIKSSLDKIFLVVVIGICYFIRLSQPLIKEGVMKSSALLLFLLVLLSGCENTKGQDRHDPNHHDKVSQNDRE
jgi:hypothetical protein